MKNYVEANREHWNELTPIHAKSDFYDVEGFKAGRSTLTQIELEELGNVSGRSLLHLQCHFGLDTLSWARLGAKVVSVDFSDRAVELARSLGRELQIDANFVLSDIYDLPNHLNQQFDIVFTSYGVLMWLPDLTRWAQVIDHFLVPGGTFYIAEFHPFAGTLYDEADATDLRIHYPYFQGLEPTKFEYSVEGSYADPSKPVSTVSFQWPHSVSSILNSLLAVGLKIEYFHEFPYCPEQFLPMMKREDDGWWRLEGDPIPLVFSIKATKV